MTGRSGGALLLVLLSLRFLSCCMSYDISLFVAQIFVGCGNVGIATAQTLWKTTYRSTHYDKYVPTRSVTTYAHWHYYNFVLCLLRPYLAWTIVTSADCLRTVGTCFAAPSSFLRLPHLRMDRVSSRKKQQGALCYQREQETLKVRIRVRKTHHTSRVTIKFHEGAPNWVWSILRSPGKRIVL